MDDVSATMKALKAALPEGTPLALAGFSQGAITASKYAIVAGADADVSCVVSLSGSLDLR